MCVCVGTSTPALVFFFCCCGTSGVVTFRVVECACVWVTGYVEYVLLCSRYIPEMFSFPATEGCRAILFIPSSLSSCPPPFFSLWNNLQRSQEVGLSPARPSGSLKSVWTKAKVTGHEAVTLPECFHKFLSARSLYTRSHVFATTRENETMCFLVISMRTRPPWETTTRSRPWESPRPDTGHRRDHRCQNTHGHTEPWRNIYSWVICLRKCYVIRFPQPDSPSAAGFLIYVHRNKAQRWVIVAVRAGVNWCCTETCETEL